jgi:GTPase SAR1 family protein
MIENKELELAWDFVEKTDRNIFLTGKAGTGKTTFLHKVKNESSKRSVIVAPTGVAAINARGVTIHSFFQMPFGPIIPDGQMIEQNKSKHKFAKRKIDIIRSLDLLIIDEISMVRADLLDGIDQVLRRYKDRNRVFGGVQVLMIGDLQQLAPVVKQNDWNLLKSYYDTAFFFSSKSFLQSNPIRIELKHIFRQKNEDFIKILNEIRNNSISEKSLENLNKQCNPSFEPNDDEGYITLTTHNDRANKINEDKLVKIKKTASKFTAEIGGDFPENAYPNHFKLEFKIGAQVMFIKNDSSVEKRFYNGKIGKIIDFDEDSVVVKCPDDDFEITVGSETWDNVKYTIDEQTKEIIEHKNGFFSQIPLRLAWAITIHKSQGLTFEKAIIDANASFAHGQTYVALSRCKTIEGIVLKTPIERRSIILDNQVLSFTDDVEQNQPDDEDLIKSKKAYQLNLINELFDYKQFEFPIKRCMKVYHQNKNVLRGNILPPLQKMLDEGVNDLIKVGNGFYKQLIELCEKIDNPEKDKTIQDRIAKALIYFEKQTKEKIETSLLELTYSTDNKAVEKDFAKALEIIEDNLAVKKFCFEGLRDSDFETLKYLKLRANSVLQKVEKKPKKVKIDYTAESANPELFEELRELRNVYAQEESVPHFQIFTQESLFEMCEILPTNPKQLKAINGMGKIRVKKYGDKIIEVIKDFCKENNVNPKEDIVPEKPPKVNTKKVSLEMLKEGKTIKEIAQERGLVVGTIESHLAEFIKTGEAKIEQVMPKERYLELKKEIEKIKNIESLNDVKHAVDDKFSYSEIHMVLNHLASLK